MQLNHNKYYVSCFETEDAKYIINVKQFAKFVVDLNEQVASTDIEEGMRVGVDRNKYQIHIPLPPKIDPSVTMMQVEEKPDVTYSDVGGCKEQIEKLREVCDANIFSCFKIRRKIHNFKKTGVS